MNNKINWFESNPKKTFLGFFIIVFLTLMFIAEIIIKKMSVNSGINHGIQRYIRLKEHKPFFSNNFILPKSALENSDSIGKNNYLLRIDENGFIMPSKIYNNADLNIVFLGGSTTECAYVSEDTRFPYLVGRLIENRTGLRVNSFNSGVSGNDSLHSIDILLNKVLPIKPNIVVMMHNVNDLSTLALEGSYWNNSPTRSVIVVEDNPYKRSLAKLKNILFPNIYAALKDILHTGKQLGEFDHVKGNKIRLNKKYLTDEFKKNMLTFISISRIRDITPVLMTQANRLKDNPDKLIERLMSHFETDYQFSYKEYKEVYDSFNQAIRDVGKENGVIVIDLADKVPQEREFMFDIAHFNDTGSKFVAAIIGERLIALINKDGSILSKK